LISVQNAGKEFQGRWIFRNLTLHVNPGDSVVLIGPSGGGKSVLLKTVAGLIPPDEGTIQVSSKNVGMLFQKNALFDSFTVEENLLFPLREVKKLTGQRAQERASRFLAQVGLDGCEKLFPDEISGGMQKRLGIARALIVEPEVILYDEPTAGLDPITSKTIADLIRQLMKETQSTLLTVTNDMQRAYQIGNQIFLLANGQLTAGGTPQEVQATNHPEIRQFIYGLKSGPLTGGLA
jgi:phospholipid/cholesterol/gamma-HCH transport system ATP-binding protein